MLCTKSITNENRQNAIVALRVELHTHPTRHKLCALGRTIRTNFDSRIVCQLIGCGAEAHLDGISAELQFQFGALLYGLNANDAQKGGDDEHLESQEHLFVPLESGEGIFVSILWRLV